jgi:hypothetical protein
MSGPLKIDTHIHRLGLGRDSSLRPVARPVTGPGQPGGRAARADGHPNWPGW